MKMSNMMRVLKQFKTPHRIREIRGDNNLYHLKVGYYPNIVGVDLDGKEIKDLFLATIMTKHLNMEAPTDLLNLYKELGDLARDLLEQGRMVINLASAKSKEQAKALDDIMGGE